MSKLNDLASETTLKPLILLKNSRAKPDRNLRKTVRAKPAETLMKRGETYRN